MSMTSLSLSERGWGGQLALLNTSFHPSESQCYTAMAVQSSFLKLLCIWRTMINSRTEKSGKGLGAGPGDKAAGQRGPDTYLGTGI